MLTNVHILAKARKQEDITEPVETTTLTTAMNGQSGHRTLLIPHTLPPVWMSVLI